MTDLSHLDAIRSRLSYERARLAASAGEPDRAFRERQIKAIEKEMVAEYEFLGIGPIPMRDLMMTDDELLSELEG